MGESKQTVVFDFDGVIHSYTSGWQGARHIPDPPVPGIQEAIEGIRAAGYEVVVVSTRCAELGGATAIEGWLDMWGIDVDRVCKEKPPAIVYIDDRAICFDGKSSELLDKIKTFKPWNNGKMGNVPIKENRRNYERLQANTDTANKQSGI